MQLKICKRIDNKIEIDENSVWVLDGHKKFDYSDGLEAERYLKKVLSQASDLSSNSKELEKWMKDWTSEYHLTSKRSQLLRGFDFNRTDKALEVGCGCGAITRFLGETFDDVISIEGSISRASLARLRTKELENVSIISAPFQEIKFKDKFDIIFCVGVFEYSGSFVDAIDPYDAILKYFTELLNPGGQLVIAIENQFGLKYFSSSSEDHTNRMFEGIEGYPNYGKRIKTFGYHELKSKINKYFPTIDFYFPYPDYKIPSCILSEEFLANNMAGELIGRFKARDYSSERKPIFDEMFTAIELDKNKQLPFFANSFLIFAGGQSLTGIKNGDLGIIYSSDRLEIFATETRFVKSVDGSLLSKKMLKDDQIKVESNKIILHAGCSKWLNYLTLQTQIIKRVSERNLTLDELLAPCLVWYRTVQKLVSSRDEKSMIHGKYIDAIWQNCVIQDDECQFFDQEWEWREKISLNLLVIRSIYLLMYDILFLSNVNHRLKQACTKKIIIDIAQLMGCKLDDSDFADFIELEAQIVSGVTGRSASRAKSAIGLFLVNRYAYKALFSLKVRYQWICKQKNRIVSRLSR